MAGISKFKRSRLKNLYGDRYDDFMARQRPKTSKSALEEKKPAAKVAAKRVRAFQ
jgi:hypothetical protein